MPSIISGLHHMDGVIVQVSMGKGYCCIDLLSNDRHDPGDDWELFFSGIDEIRKFHKNLGTAIKDFDSGRKFNQKRPLRATESDDLEGGKGLIPPNSGQNPKEVA